jgi:hypothetical protein
LSDRGFRYWVFSKNGIAQTHSEQCSYKYADYGNSLHLLTLLKASTFAQIAPREWHQQDVIVIPWADLIEVEAGSEADLRSRVTVSRLLLTGIFAFGLKKERKKGFFISIANPSSLGLFEVNTSGSNNRANEKKARVFAAACNARIRSANPAGIAKAEASSSTNYDEIEKLGELLNKGLLTQKEFDAKKKQILGL